MPDQSLEKGGNKNKVYTGPRNGKYIIKIVDGKKIKQYIKM